MPKPWQSRQEYLTDMALESASMPVEAIQAIRPQGQQYLFPETRGIAKQIPTIMEVLNVDRYAASNRSWVSGMPVMGNDFNSGEFSGSGRYSMEALG